MIPQSFIQDLLDRVDVVNVVGNYVQLKKAGANFQGLCPFHTEKSPSFTVSPTKQFFHCFGCGKNGTAIGFLMDYAGMSFVDAVHELAKMAGVTVPEEKNPVTAAKKIEQQAKSQTLSEVMTRAYHFYRQELKEATQAIAYLRGRGLSGEVAAHFGLGYAPDMRNGLHQEFADYAAKELVEAGLVIERNEEEAGSAANIRRYDRFRDRIIFPIRNIRGQVIGFGGRILEKGEPKYLNSPETPLFQKGNELYGLFEARQAIRTAGYVLIVEGYMDVVALTQLGYPQSVATLGTACTPVQVQKLMRQTDTLVFAFDGDTAGKKAAVRAMEASLPYVGDNKSMRFLFLPAEHDPDSYIRENGAEAFEKLVQQAMPLSELLFQEIVSGNDLNTMEGRARAQFRAKAFFQAIPPSALRLQMLRKLAQITQTPETELGALLGGQAKQRVPKQPAHTRNARQPVVKGQERRIIRWLLSFPELVFELDEDEMEIMQACEAESASLMQEICHAVHALGDGVSFASLFEYLRESGKNYEAWVAEVSAEEYDVELPFARQEIREALLSLQIKKVEEELKSLASANILWEEKKPQYQVLQQELEKLTQKLAEIHASGKQ